MPEKLLEMKGIKKFFGGVKALNGVNLSINKGEVHCLAGENGCGKSTIIKVISGFYTPDGGEILFDGNSYEKLKPAEAIDLGIQVIYQDFSVFPNLTVRENLAINKIVFENKKFTNKKEQEKIAKEALKKINFEIDLNTRVEDLPVSEKQLIAIARALMSKAKLIIMDEPTTALTDKEIQRLFDIIKTLKSEGVTVIFVSHKLEEVYSICDNITILRNGKNVTSCAVADLTEEDFIFYMTGRNFETLEEDSSSIGKPLLEFKSVFANGLSDINFTLNEGEILGITGQLGSGRTELSLTMFGMNKPTQGEIFISQEKVDLNSPTEAIAHHIALVPEDRLSEGLFLSQSISNNIVVSNFDDLANKIGYISDKDISKMANDWVKQIGVATSDPELPVSTLSGGNQQKVVLARWLATSPKILILNGPTVGVDIGAKFDIHHLLRDAVQKGMSIIVVSDDIREITSLCDRILIMNQGTIIEEIQKTHFSSSEYLTHF